MDNNQRPHGGTIQARINIDLNKLETMKCSCGNETFITLYQLKHVSAFYTQNGKDQGIELKQYVCLNPQCGRMFVGAMKKADIKKTEKEHNLIRFDWIDFFVSGVALVEAFVNSQNKTDTNLEDRGWDAKKNGMVGD
jgi:hypothetical protein